MLELCRRCGHGKNVHQHFSSATYCGVCPCPRYRRPRRRPFARIVSALWKVTRRG